MKLDEYLAMPEITQKGFGDEVGVTQGMVHQWLRNIRRVSSEKVIPVARATNWQVTPHELRPDIYPNPSDGLPAEVAEGEGAA